VYYGPGMLQYQPPFLVFVDESGDHNMKKGGDPCYPILVLVAVIISPREYQKAKSAFDGLKQKHFGTINVILHERDIRKGEREPFSKLGKQGCQKLMEDIDVTIRELNFKIVAAIIDKKRLACKYEDPKDPYYLATHFILERVQIERDRTCGPSGVIPIYFERRGKKEDRKLQSFLTEIKLGKSLISNGPIPNLDPKFVSKQDNEIGLQIADLIARPIGLNYLGPSNPNRAYNTITYDTIESKFRRNSNGKIEGFGLKIFPQEPCDDT